MRIHEKSEEAEKLIKLIQNKKQYLSKLTGKPSAKFVEEEIRFLERDLFPIVAVETNIFYHELVKYFIKALDLSLEHKADGMLLYLTIVDEFKEKPRIAIFNAADYSKNRAAVAVRLDRLENTGDETLGIDYEPLPLESFVNGKS